MFLAHTYTQTHTHTWGYQETLGAAEHVYYLYCDDRITGVCISTNSAYTLNICNSLCVNYTSIKLLFKKANNRDFPGGSVAKNPPANAGDMGSILGLVVSHMLRSN